MRRGIIVNLKRFKFLDYVTHNKIFILLCVLFVTGLTLGAIFVSKNSWLSKNVQMLFKGFVSVHIKDNFFKESVREMKEENQERESFLKILILGFEALFGEQNS